MFEMFLMKVEMRSILLNAKLRKYSGTLGGLNKDKLEGTKITLITLMFFGGMH